MQNFSSDPQDQLGQHGILCRLVWLLANAKPERNGFLIQESWNRGASLVERVDAYLRCHLNEPLKIADIAAHTNMSISALQHNYRREKEETPMRVLRKMRIEEAKALLARGGIGLDMIAFETGFCDAFHLSRTFKAQEGISPKDYRVESRLRP